jgi:peptidyl-prolyl cis-trans isomerase C
MYRAAMKFSNVTVRFPGLELSRPAFTRDPLFWFVILGALCFASYALVTGGKHEVHVSRAVQMQLVEDHELLLGRKPNDAELARLLKNYIDGEILFQESLQQSMHTGDLKTKQRLIEKMRFLLTGAVNDPTDVDLVNFYAEHPEYYHTEPKYSFVQTFFTQAPAEQAGVLRRLQAGERVAGDEFWLGERLQAYDESMVRGVLGQPFIEALRAARPGEWTGPIQTPRGWHYVRVESIAASKMMPFAEIREQIAQDWLEAQRTQSVAAKLDVLRRKYDVQIEQ